jgi:DNA-binding CsgD family transcriptional regulator/Tfp pilus assembly protein PilF
MRKRIEELLYRLRFTRSQRDRFTLMVHIAGLMLDYYHNGPDKLVLQDAENLADQASDIAESIDNYALIEAYYCKLRCIYTRNDYRACYVYIHQVEKFICDSETAAKFWILSAEVFHALGIFHQAELYLRKAIDLSAEKPDLYAYVACRLCGLYAIIGKIGRANELYAIAMEKADKDIMEELMPLLEVYRSRTLVEEGNYPRAIYIAEKAVGLLQRKKYVDIQAIEAYINLGIVYLRAENTERALNALHKAAELCRNSNNEHYMITVEFYIGIYHMLNNEHIKANTYFKSVEEKIKFLPGHIIQNELLTYKGYLLMHDYKYAQAAEFFLNSFDEAIRNNNIIQHILSLLGYGKCCMEIESHTNSYECYSAALYLADHSNNNALQAMSRIYIAEYMKREDNIEKALEYLEIPEAFCRSTGKALLLDRILRLKSHCLQSIHKMDEALECERERVSILRTMEAYSSQEIKERLSSLVEKDKYVQEIQRLYSVNKILEEQLESRNAELKEIARKILDSTSDPLSPSISSDQNRALSVEFIAKLANNKSRLFYELNRLFPVLTHKEKEICCLLAMDYYSKDMAILLRLTPREIDNYRYKIRKKIGIKEEGNNIGRYLREIERNAMSTQVTPQFSEGKLSAIAPDLTAQELKICNFVFCGMSTRDISRALAISERTVENHRFRIRKKLHAQNSANLFTILQCVIYGSMPSQK